MAGWSGGGARGRAAPAEAYCGYGTCRPRRARVLTNMKTFSLNLSLIVLLHIGFYSYFVGVMRTMEKRFALTSSQTGMLNSTNDFVQVFIVLFIGYIGQRAHKPRMLSLIILLTFLAAFIFAGPYFIFGKQVISTGTSMEMKANTSRRGSSEGPRLCRVTSVNGSESCGTEEEKQQVGHESYVAFVVVAIGCVALGIGGSSYSTLGLSYIDENAKKNSSIYIGVVTSMYPWGPIVGFLLAALCTSIPEGITGPSVPTTDPNFIGAWWLGFVIIGTAVFCCSIPLFFFPKHMPEFYEEEEQSRLTEKGTPSDPPKDENVTSLFKEFPRLFGILIRKKAFWSHSLSQVCGLYVIVGVLIQQPRYLEAHFHQTAAMAGILAATSGAVSGVLGNLAGGIIMRRFKLKPPGMAVMVVVATVIACLGTVIKLLLPCPPVNMVGHVDPGDPGTLQLSLPCNANCSCSKVRMEPICVGGSQTYFSACHAGCSLQQNGTFSDCSCIGVDETVVRGMCETKCDMLIPYVIGYFIITLLSLTGRVPSTILTFRIVGPDMRSFALGFFSFLLDLLSPIVFGMLVDSTCLIWQETCGKRGACLFYDIRKLRLLPHGVTLCFQVAGLLLSVLTWWLVKNDKALAASSDIKEVTATVVVKEDDVKLSVQEKVTTT